MPWNTAGNIKGPKGDKGDPGNAADIAALIHAATAKIPADADELPILDSGASWDLRKFTWASLKTALQDVFFYRGNIVGTVSQSGGVPTGAIMQRGINANGEFVRFADGTQICFIAPFVGYGTGNTFKTWPASFSSEDVYPFLSITPIEIIDYNARVFPSGTGQALFQGGIANTGNTVRIAGLGRWF